jgi:hypothetical protein
MSIGPSRQRRSTVIVTTQRYYIKNQKYVKKVPPFDLHYNQGAVAKHNLLQLLFARLSEI